MKAAYTVSTYFWKSEPSRAETRNPKPETRPPNFPIWVPFKFLLKKLNFRARREGVQIEGESNLNSENESGIHVFYLFLTIQIEGEFNLNNENESGLHVFYWFFINPKPETPDPWPPKPETRPPNFPIWIPFKFLLKKLNFRARREGVQIEGEFNLNNENESGLHVFYLFLNVQIEGGFNLNSENESGLHVF